jgi:uncharacterized membrane protein
MKKKKADRKKNNKAIVFTVIGIAVIIIVIAVSFLSNNNGTKTVIASMDDKAGGIVIQKADITETASFIPYQAGGTKMEVIAVKASDGTIRTAFNTCQVCYKSGKGYYVQEGDEFVCQNCGNRFKISQVEKEKNGCNPVPVLSPDKTEDDKNITISADFLAQNVGLFGNWKK